MSDYKSLLKQLEEKGFLEKASFDIETPITVPLEYKINPVPPPETPDRYYHKWAEKQTSKDDTQITKSTLTWNSTKNSDQLFSTTKLAEQYYNKLVTMTGVQEAPSQWIDYIKSPEKLTKPNMWTLAEAREFISTRLQDWARLYGYHVCLGGGVLNKGKSTKDVDIYFLPMNNGDGNRPKELLVELQKMLLAELVSIGSEYPEQMLPYSFKGKMILPGSNKRIDFFLMGNEVLLEADWKIDMTDYMAQSIELDPDNIIHYKKVK